jgi:uncharacterized membrane protein YkvA (DUF1232 family)
MARYALVVGISEYKSRHLDNLSKPVGDAEAIASLLQKYGQCDQEPTVLKGKVTTEKLVKTLKTFLNEQAVNNEAIIYFTGHGVSVKDSLDETQGYLTTSDCEVTVSGTQPIAQQNAIPFSSLNSLIQKANLSNLILLMDACHSGDFIERRLVEQSFSVFSAKQDHCLITACRGFESSWAKKSDDHSVFTQAVLSALVPENADAEGCITGDRLFDHLSNALKGSRQEAVRYSKGRSLSVVKFPLELLPEKAPRAAGSEGAVRKSRLPTVPLQMPPLPDHFVERPEQQEVLKAELLCESAKVGTLVVSAIYGLGGIGKSVLASKLTHDRDVQQHFADGILWATLGQSPDILPLLSGWIQALGDRDYKPTAIESASNHLRTLLYDKRTLLVVDDVWNSDHLEPFRVGGERSCVLVTTREARITEARRYSLDMMKPEQALELMTQKLSAPLSKVARQQALDFAARVGYLPLALDLAASQIEEGVTWQELLEDFQAEFARLETLDTYAQEEKPEDEKRRKNSLVACFNLSLKQLSAEQLRQFAWLGVMPEDVSMTQEMAETLWQVTARQSGSILRTFRAKSLVLQGASQTDERTSYRMHDVMHDMAQRLLDNPPLPVREGELPGLGLTKAEAHSQLLERYRAQTRNGEWHTLVDDGYIYAHLTWHMEQAKQPQALHQLLRASNEEGRNGWYEACDAIGQPAGFVNDMGRAWQLAVADYEQAPGKSVALLFRYALMRTSLNSLASNVPAELVGALVKHGVWQAAQGLAYAQQAQNPWQRAACISAIVPYLPKALLPEVLKTVGQIKDAAYRSYVLSKLVERFPELWPEVLTTIQQIQDRYGNHRQQTQGFSYKALAIISVTERVPLSYLDETLEITRHIQDASDQSSALSELAKQLPELLPEALAVTREIKDEASRAFALSELTKQLPELLPEALAVTREIKDEASRASVLRELAKQLPELLPEALAVTREIKYEAFFRALALSELTEHLPGLWPEVLEIIQETKDEFFRVQALCQLAEHLPLELLPKALEMTREIRMEAFRASVLRKLAEHLPLELLPKALEMTREIKSDFRARALSALAKHLPELWPEALAMTREIKNGTSRAFALSELAGQLPSELCPDALEMTREIKDEASHALTLSKLAEHLPELWTEALEMTREIEDESSRARALRELTEHLPLELWTEALGAIREIKNEASYALTLGRLARHLPELWSEVLEMMRKIKDESSRASTLGELAEHLSSELLPEALEMTQKIKDESSRARALSALAKHLSSELLPEALEMTRKIKDESSRASTLGELAEHLPSELLPEALEMTRKIEDESSRAHALSALAEHLPSELLPEALEMTRKIEDASSRAHALRELAKNLSELYPEALEMTREIKDESSRAHALIALAKNLSELWPKALEMTQEIKDESSRAFTLRKLTEHLPLDLWPDALEMTQDIKDEFSRASTLVGLAESLPLELWPKALEMTREIKDEPSRSYVLSELEKNLPSELLSEALKIVWLIQDKYYCANALRGFIPYLETLSIPFSDWVRVLDTLAYQNRSILLTALPDSRATVIRLGNSQAFSEILQAVRDVCQQWP